MLPFNFELLKVRLAVELPRTSHVAKRMVRVASVVTMAVTLVVPLLLVQSHVLLDLHCGLRSTYRAVDERPRPVRVGSA